FAQEGGPDVLQVRRKLPPLSRAQVDRLPPRLRDDHRAWQEAALRTSPGEEQRRRARRLALSLFELGESIEGAEQQLHRWRFHPALAHDAVAWAWDRHRVAARAAARAREEEAAESAGGDAA
ncbi:MAG TPA: hypothetical protein VD926_09470, partial [Acidimicrobiales bacterium]|nr:hypothetical protein [Acidimicrobiales bacterium]